MANDGRNVSLTERHRHFIDLQVETGRHASASEVVREALRRYESDLEAERAAIDALWAQAEKSETGEAAGDFTNVRDDAHLGQLMDRLLTDAAGQVRSRRSA
jgi:antitoxin ParD1/3/4